jgi:hypothetical protein
MPTDDAIDHELRREYRDLPTDDAAPAAPLEDGQPDASAQVTGSEDETESPSRTKDHADLDPRAALAALGARWSPDFDAYASAKLGPFRCALCGQAPCACQHCTATYVSYLGAESVCGMTLRAGECPRGGTGADHGRESGPS